MSGDGNKKATRSSSRGKRDKAAASEESTKAEDTAAADSAATTATKSKDTASKKDTKDAKKDTKDTTTEETPTKKEAATVKKEEAAEEGKDTGKDATEDTKATTEEATAAIKTGEDEDVNDTKQQEDGVNAAGAMDATTPSKEVIRTVYWPAAERRYDEITIQDDFEFDDESQSITGICGKPPRHFPNTHFMRRLAGHLRLGLGRNATKEAILEKICQAHYGAAFTRPPVEDETSSSKKRRSSDASTVLKKRPVIMKSGGSSKKASGGGANAASTMEATLKARAAALTAVSASLETIATTIRQAEERLQKLCEAAKVDFYVALMDRSKLTNDYLRTHFAEYDQFLATRKEMIASITELSKGNDLKGPVSSTSSAGGNKTTGAGLVGGVAAMTVGIAIPAASGPDPEEVTNHMEV